MARQLGALTELTGDVRGAGPAVTQAFDKTGNLVSVGAKSGLNFFSRMAAGWSKEDMEYSGVSGLLLESIAGRALSLYDTRDVRIPHTIVDDQLVMPGGRSVPLDEATGLDFYDALPPVEKGLLSKNGVERDTYSIYDYDTAKDRYQYRALHNGLTRAIEQYSEEASLPSRFAGGTLKFGADLLTDPLNLIPFLGIASKAARGATTGGRILTTAVATAAVKKATLRGSRRTFLELSANSLKKSSRDSVFRLQTKLQKEALNASIGKVGISGLSKTLQDSLGRNAIVLGGGALSGAGATVGTDFSIHNTLLANDMIQEEWEPDISSGILGGAIGMGFGFAFMKGFDLMAAKRVGRHADSVKEVVEHAAIYNLGDGVGLQQLLITKGLHNKSKGVDMDLVELADGIEGAVTKLYDGAPGSFDLMDRVARYVELGLYDAEEVPTILAQVSAILSSGPSHQDFARLFPDPDLLEREIKDQVLKAYNSVFTPAKQAQLIKLGEKNAVRLEKLSGSDNPLDWTSSIKELGDLSRVEQGVNEIVSAANEAADVARAATVKLRTIRFDEFDTTRTLAGQSSQLDNINESIQNLSARRSITEAEKLVALTNQKRIVEDNILNFLKATKAFEATQPLDAVVRSLQAIRGTHKGDSFITKLTRIGESDAESLKKQLIERDLLDIFSRPELARNPDSFMRVWMNPALNALDGTPIARFANWFANIGSNAHRVNALGRKDYMADVINSFMFQNYNSRVRAAGANIVSMETHLTRLQGRYTQDYALPWSNKLRELKSSTDERFSLTQSAYSIALGGSESGAHPAAVEFGTSLKKLFGEIQDEALLNGTIGEITSNWGPTFIRGNVNTTNFGEDLYKSFLSTYDTADPTAPLHKGTLKLLREFPGVDKAQLRTIKDLEAVANPVVAQDYFRKLREIFTEDMNVLDESAKFNLHAQSRQAAHRRTGLLTAENSDGLGFNITGRSGRISQPDFSRNRKIEQQFYADHPEYLDGNIHSILTNAARFYSLEVKMDGEVAKVTGRKDYGWRRLRNVMDDIIQSRARTARVSEVKDVNKLSGVYGGYIKAVKDTERTMLGFSSREDTKTVKIMEALSNVALATVAAKASAVGALGVELPLTISRVLFDPDGLEVILRSLVDVSGNKVTGISRDIADDTYLTMRQMMFDPRYLIDGMELDVEVADSLSGRVSAWRRSITDPNRVAPVIRDATSSLSLERWATGLGKVITAQKSYTIASKRLKNVGKYFDLLPDPADFGRAGGSGAFGKDTRNALRVFGNQGDALAFRQANLLDPSLRRGYEDYYAKDDHPFKRPQKMIDAIATQGDPQVKAQMQEIKNRVSDFARQEANTWSPTASALERVSNDNPVVKALTMFTGYPRAFYSRLLPRMINSPMHQAMAQVSMFIMLETAYQSYLAVLKGKSVDEVTTAWRENTDSMLLQTLGGMPFLGPYTGVLAGVTSSIFTDQTNPDVVRVGMPSVNVFNDFFYRTARLTKATLGDSVELTPSDGKYWRNTLPGLSLWQVGAANAVRDAMRE